MKIHCKILSRVIKKEYYLKYYLFLLFDKIGYDDLLF